MISLIICSRSPTISILLQENIAATIGTEYELLVIDNSNNQYNIFEAYNLGVQRSNFPYLCFMHDDISYYTSNWGIKLMEYFNAPKTGAIGIAGSPYAPKMAGSWWGGELVNETLVHKDGQPRIKKIGDINADRTEVVVLDGVWICIRKSLFQEIRFDEETYSGFHFYDIDISMQIHQTGYKLYCVSNILIQHLSASIMNNTWVHNARLFNKKWGEYLPVALTHISYYQKCNAEYKTLNEYTRIMESNHFPQREIYTMAIGSVLNFHKGYFYYKTPYFLFKYLTRLYQNKHSGRETTT